jgi:AraC-like DNA-binding protein
MRYAEYAPAPRHAAIVECYWFLEGNGAGVPDTIVPDGRVEVIFHYGAPFRRHHTDGTVETQPRAILAGQMLSPIALSHTGLASVAAIRLRPAAVHSVIRCHAAEITSRVLDLEDVMPGSGRRVPELLAEADDDRARIAILDGWLARAVRTQPRPDVDAAVQLILATGGAGQLRGIASRAGLSLRHLERRFAHDVGLQPKVFARIVRLQTALRAIASGASLGDAALACGYFDQAHMTRDFTRLADMSPAAWRRQEGALATLFVS